MENENQVSVVHVGCLKGYPDGNDFETFERNKLNHPWMVNIEKGSDVYRCINCGVEIKMTLMKGEDKTPEVIENVRKWDESHEF